MDLYLSLFEKAGAGAEKAGEGLVRKAEGTSLGRGALNLFGNDSWELGLTTEGKAVEKMANTYDHNELLLSSRVFKASQRNRGFRYP